MTWFISVLPTLLHSVTRGELYWSWYQGRISGAESLGSVCWGRTQKRTRSYNEKVTTSNWQNKIMELGSITHLSPVWCRCANLFATNLIEDKRSLTHTHKAFKKEKRRWLYNYCVLINWHLVAVFLVFLVVQYRLFCLGSTRERRVKTCKKIYSKRPGSRVAFQDSIQDRYKQCMYIWLYICVHPK